MKTDFDADTSPEIVGHSIKTNHKIEFHFHRQSFNHYPINMNSAINNALQQYLDTFMDTVAERFEINRDELNDLWKETQKKKFTKKNKSTKRKKSSVPSAYILFCQDERAKIKESNPEIDFVQIAKELGKRWRNATDNTKEHYKKQHDILLQQHQQTLTTTIASIMTDEEEEVSTTEEVVVEVEATPMVQDEEKPKKTKKPKKTIEIPEDITNERERDLWPEFAKMTIAELRTQCEHNNIKSSKKRDDMIRALVVHRIALEDGNTQIDSDDDNNDSDED